jgi:Flp pilus assembly protein TadG
MSLTSERLVLSPVRSTRAEIARRFVAVRTFWSGEGGSVSVVFAIALIPVVMLVGAAIDYSRASSARTHLQAAMDAAVLAGASRRSDQTATAQTVFSAHLQSGQYTLKGASFSLGGDASVTGTASADVATSLLAAVSIDALSVSVTATAKPVRTSNVCVLLVDPTAAQPLLVNGGASLKAPNCEVHVRSGGSPAAIFNSGSSFVTKRTCLAGSSPIYNSTSVANVETRCSAAVDPFAGTLPVPSSSSCTVSNGNYGGGSVGLSPGVYCGWFNFNNAPNVTFAPGVYVIKGGGWNVNGGTWSGTGVTFYFADSSVIQFNSGIAANLTAPTSGTYAGILIYEAAGLSKSNFVFNDSVANNLDGLIYLPSRNVTFNAKSQLNTDQATLVFNTLILDQTNWNLDVGTGKTIAASGSASNILMTR